MSDLRKRANRGEIPANVLTLEDAFRETVHNVCEPKQLAEAAQIRYRDLCDLANPFSSRRPRAAEIAPLINGTFLVTGRRSYLILDVIERQVGRVGIQMPIVDVGDRQAVELAVATLKEFSEHQQEYSTLIARGDISEADAARHEREANEAIAAIEMQKQAVRARVRQPGGLV